RHRARRSTQIAAGVAALVLCAPLASGQQQAHHQDRLACEHSFESAVRLEQAGQLRDAQKMLLGCTKNLCDRFLQYQCIARYAEMDADIPSVVPIVTDED